MELESAKIIGAAIAAGFGVLGPAIGVGLVASRATEGIARNPEAYNRIFSTMILGAALAEALGILALVVAFVLRFV